MPHRVSSPDWSCGVQSGTCRFDWLNRAPLLRKPRRCRAEVLPWHGPWPFGGSEWAFEVLDWWARRCCPVASSSAFEQRRGAVESIDEGARAQSSPGAVSAWFITRRIQLVRDPARLGFGPRWGTVCARSAASWWNPVSFVIRFSPMILSRQTHCQSHQSNLK